MPYIIWVKKLVSHSEYKNWYSKNDVFCPLRKDTDGMWMGFLVADVNPSTCQEIRDYSELQIIDRWRKSNNVRSQPFDDDEYFDEDGYVQKTNQDNRSQNERLESVKIILNNMKETLSAKGIIRKNYEEVKQNRR